jgi:hypothetical protein
LSDVSTVAILLRIPAREQPCGAQWIPLIDEAGATAPAPKEQAMTFPDRNANPIALPDPLILLSEDHILLLARWIDLTTQISGLALGPVVVDEPAPQGRSESPLSHLAELALDVPRSVEIAVTLRLKPRSDRPDYDPHDRG